MDYYYCFLKKNIFEILIFFWINLKKVLVIKKLSFWCLLSCRSALLRSHDKLSLFHILLASRDYILIICMIKNEVFLISVWNWESFEYWKIVSYSILCWILTLFFSQLYLVHLWFMIILLLRLLAIIFLLIVQISSLFNFFW